MSDLASWRTELPPIHVEPTPRRVRVRAGDTLVAESDRAMLLRWYGPGMLPTYCLPADDVRTELLHASESPRGRTPHTVEHDVRTDDTVVERAALLVRDAPPEMAAVEGFWTFAWERGLSWFEEAFEVHVHARDPHKRVDVVPSDRHVVVELDGHVLAESRRPHALFESPLPTRWYLPLDDVNQDLLIPSDTVTMCPYKGTASYFSVRREDDDPLADVAWTYLDPIPECPRVKGLVAFFNEKVDLIIDGERVPRPQTPWS